MKTLKNIFRTLCILLLFSSCTYEIISETTFYDDRTIDLVMSVDLNKTMTSENREAVMGMIGGLTSNLANAKPNNVTKEFDFSKLDISKNKKFYQRIAFDTLPFMNSDTLIKALSNSKAPLGININEESKKELANFFDKVLKNMILDIQIDLNNNIFKTSIEMHRIKYDYFYSEEFKNVIKSLVPDSTLNQLKKNNTLANMKWKKNKVSWDGYEGKNILPDTKTQGNPQTQMLMTSLLNSNMIFIYHFPHTIAKSKNDVYILSEDGKTLTMEASLKEIMENKIDISNNVKYKRN